MNRRVWRYLALGLGLYILFLIVTAPASLLAWALARTSNNALALDSVTGTLWRGSGDLSYTRAHTGAYLVGRTEWSVNPLWLVRARIGVTTKITNTDAILNAGVILSRGELGLRKAHLRAPASVLQTFYPPLSLAAPTGNIEFNAEEFTMRRDSIVGRADLFWRAAGVQMSDVKPLGDYKIELVGKDASASLNAVTLTGPLSIAGAGTLDLRSGRLRWDLSAHALAEKERLAPLLSLMGRDQGGGARTISIDTAIPLMGDTKR